MTEKTLKPGWKVWPFDQMAHEVKDRIDHPVDSGLERYVGLEHLDTGSLKIWRWGSTSDVEKQKLLFKSGDIIFGRRNAYLRRVAVADFDGVCSAHAMVLRAHEDVVLPEFLPFFMQTDGFWEAALKVSAGSMSPTINWPNIAKEEFLLPPLDEQRRIAEMLQSAADVVEMLQVLFRSAQILKKKIIEGILNGEVDQPTFKAQNKYKNGDGINLEELPKLPRGWYWMRAEEVCDFITKGATPSKKDISNDQGDVPFIKVYNLTFTGELDFTVNPTFINKKVHSNELARSKVFPGDVLMNIVGPPLGKVSVVPDTYTEWNINQAIVFFRPVDNYYSDFLAEYLLLDITQQWLYRRSKKTSGQRNLTLEMCRDLPLPIFPESSANTIYRIIRSLNNTLVVINNNLVNAGRLYRALLNRVL